MFHFINRLLIKQFQCLLVLFLVVLKNDNFFLSTLKFFKIKTNIIENFSDKSSMCLATTVCKTINPVHFIFHVDKRNGHNVQQSGNLILFRVILFRVILSSLILMRADTCEIKNLIFFLP